MPGAMKKSLNRKILVALTASVAAVMTAAVYFSVSHETREMLHEVSMNSEELSSAIYAGIKYPMSVGDSGAVEQSLLEMRKFLGTVEVFICDIDRNIRFSSHKERIGQYLEAHIGNKDVINALSVSLKSGRDPAIQEYMEHISGRSYLLHMHVIPNGETCFRCHGRDKPVLGAVVLRKSIDRNFAAIADMKTGIIVLNFAGVIAIIALANTLMVRLVTRPIGALAGEVKKLPEYIADGNIVNSRTAERRDEIGVLQQAFYDLAVEIYEKNHAIEKSNNDLAKLNRELEAFAYSVSHDLRAPLRNIDGFSKILLDDYAGKLDDKAKHYLTRVRSGTERMSILIDDMLTFSRIGRAELQFKKVKCADIIRPILEYYSAEIGKRGVSVVLQELPEINCDPVLIQSLFSNLISNALKYSRHTEQAQITIGYDSDSKAFFVRDNGVGFDMQYHDKIFHVFQRLHLPEEYEGTGIGLAIVRRIAERHSGSVWAESEPGRGAVFYVDLPTF